MCRGTARRAPKAAYARFILGCGAPRHGHSWKNMLKAANARVDRLLATARTRIGEARANGWPLAGIRELFGTMRYRRLKQHADSAYGAYLDLQRNRSARKRRHTSAVEVSRKQQLTRTLAAYVNLHGLRKALVVGCRDAGELDLLERAGVSDVVGIDLISGDRRIRIMDMHRMAFADGTFDLVYASHCLEHAYDLGATLAEMIRVLKHRGILLIEVPVDYQVTAADRHDVRSADNLLALIAAHATLERVYLREDVPRKTPTNPSGTAVARIIAAIGKKRRPTAAAVQEAYG